MIKTEISKETFKHFRHPVFFFILFTDILNANCFVDEIDHHNLDNNIGNLQNDT